MTKGKKKRNRQSSNAPVADLNAGDSSDSGELKSQPTNSESTPCNKLHWSSSHLTLSVFNSYMFFVLVLKHPCSHVKKAVNKNIVRKRLQKCVVQCSDAECENNNLEVCKSLCYIS